MEKKEYMTINTKVNEIKHIIKHMFYFLIFHKFHFYEMFRKKEQVIIKL